MDPDGFVSARQVIIPQHEIEAWAGQETDIILQVKPGSQVIVESAPGDMPQPVPKNSSMMDFDGNSSAAPFADDGKTHFKTSVEFIYWKRTNGLGFLASGDGDGRAISSRGKNYVSGFQFDPGLQASIGFDLPVDGWDANLSYLWLRSTGRRNFTEGPEDTGVPAPQNFLTEPEGISGVSHAGQKMDQTLNYLQLELGRQFYTSKWLTVRPFIDIAALYVPLSMETSYRFTSVNPAAAQHTTLATHAHGLGFGAGLGLNTEWKASRHWSFLGDLNLNAIWDRFEARGKSKVTNFTTGTTLTNLLTGYSTSQLLYLVNIFIGADWHKKFHKEKFYFSAYAGWDFFAGLSNYLIGGVGTLAFNEVGNQTLLVQEPFDYQGLRAGLKFDF